MHTQDARYVLFSRLVILKVKGARSAWRSQTVLCSF